MPRCSRFPFSLFCSSLLFARGLAKLADYLRSFIALALTLLQVSAEFLLGLGLSLRDLSADGHCTGNNSAEISELRGHDDAVGF